MAGCEGKVCSQAPAWEVTGLPQSIATAIIVADIVLKSRVYTPRELCAPKRWEPFRKSDSSCHHRKSKKNGELPLQGFPEQELAVLGATMEGNPPQDSGRVLPHPRTCPSVGLFSPQGLPLSSLVTSKWAAHIKEARAPGAKQPHCMAAKTTKSSRMPGVLPLDKQGCSVGFLAQPPRGEGNSTVPRV